MVFHLAAHLGWRAVKTGGIFLDGYPTCCALCVVCGRCVCVCVGGVCSVCGVCVCVCVCVSVLWVSVWVCFHLAFSSSTHPRNNIIMTYRHSCSAHGAHHT